MFSEQTYRGIVRASAWYDLVVPAAFATPWTFPTALALASWASRSLGLNDTFPEFSPSHTLFANLLGSVVVVWALVRITRPEPWLGRYDALSRLLFAAWQSYAVSEGAPRIILAFTVFEIAFGVAEASPIRRSRMAANKPSSS